MKYCRTCGKEMNDAAAVCVGCGVPAGTGAKFCPNCGSETTESAVVCVKCGGSLGAKPSGTNNSSGDKSKVAAGILAIILGVWGIHSFYLGRTGRGIAQLLLGTVGAFVFVGPIISTVWGIIEGIQILTGKITTDAAGRPLT